MPLEKHTEYGKISVSDRVFEDAIARLCQQPLLYDKVWLASKPNIKVSYNEDNKVILSFSVYVKFGQSIKGICKKLSDRMAKMIHNRSGEYPGSIKVNVSGVKSQTLVRRNIDYLFEYKDDSHGILISFSD